MNDPRKMRKAVYTPFAFSMVPILMELVRRLLVPGDAGDLVLWFLPMCFFFVAQTQLMLIGRIEALEAKAKP